MTQTLTATEKRPGQLTLLKKLDQIDYRILLALSMLVTAVVYWQFQFFSASERGDRANWDYIAQLIVRGGVPYRDIVNIKSPLSAYLGAAFIFISEPFGLRDLFAIRAGYFLLAVTTVGMTSLVAYVYFKSRAAALLAAAVMLTFNSFPNLNAGIQPKTPMVLFGLLALLAVKKERPFWAGVCGMLSALSWQPGLLFAGAAGLAFSGYLTLWRDRRWLWVAAGAALPLAITIIYFWAAGALLDFYQWTFHFNLSVYGPREVRPVSQFFYWFNQLLHRPYRFERYYFYIAAAGLLLWVAMEVRFAFKHGVRRLLDRSLSHALPISAVVYFLFCMTNIQGGADLIPMLPFVAIYASFLIVEVVRIAVRAAQRGLPSLPGGVIYRLSVAAAVITIFSVSVADAFSLKRRFPTLRDQDAAVAEIRNHLGPGDQIWVHGQTEILVLLGLTNHNKHYFLDRGKDIYLDRVEEGGFAGWFERLKADRPKVVGMSRMKSVERGKEIRSWVRENYERIDTAVMPYYLRKD